MKSVANYGARHDRMNITNDDFLKLPVPVASEEEKSKVCDFIGSLVLLGAVAADVCVASCKIHCLHLLTRDSIFCFYRKFQSSMIEEQIAKLQEEFRV